jgi:hypothetical protein
MMYDPKSDRDNHANQLNSEHEAYWSSRGMEMPEGSAENEDDGD